MFVWAMITCQGSFRQRDRIMVGVGVVILGFDIGFGLVLASGIVMGPGLVFGLYRVSTAGQSSLVHESYNPKISFFPLSFMCMCKM